MSIGLEIRDPIHGFIYREPHEQDIMDSKIFQRLRKLKQLALAYLVYPGAVHTRFDHSLGAFHIARRVASRLSLDADESRLLRLAALLHDVGHPPFSHVSEPILQENTDPSRIQLKQKQQVHELITAHIIRTDPELMSLILEKDRNKIIGLLEGTQGYTILKDIISGPLDVDKQDYLLRDSYFCGVRYGLYDHERLINSLLIHADEEDKFLAISRDGTHVLEQFVLAKYYMSTQVYRHRIRLITDAMVGRGISLGIKVDKIAWLKAIYSFDGTSEYVKEFLTWNDDRLIVKILEERPDSYAHSIFSRLMERRLLKSILDVDSKDFVNPAARMMVFAPSKDFHRPLEKMIADKFKFDANLVICQLIEFKSAVKTESEILVVQPTKATFFNEESTLFGAVNQAIHEQRFQIYAPARYSDERDKKKQLREFKNEIIAMIEHLANSTPLKGASKRRKV